MADDVKSRSDDLSQAATLKVIRREYQPLLVLQMLKEQ